MVEPSYLQTLQDDNTHHIEKTLPQVFEYLYDTYGDVTIKELAAMCTKLEGLTFTKMCQ